ncbi:MAG TPA: hypothetical protein P5267_00135 [Patescibacteria group bacterium]|nr:hypothetical protein [Patescibacteria group bacterium]
MQKVKNNSLLLISFALAVAVVFSLVSISAAKNTSAQTQAGKQVRQMNINNDSASTSTPEQAKNKSGQANAEAHISTVANFVQTLLKTASSTDGGLGVQVRVIAREQNHSATTTVEAMERVQTRSKIKTFLFGSDYKNLGVLRSEMVQTRNRLEQLNRLTERATSTMEFRDEITSLEQEQNKIETFIQEQESKFSLFGWLVKLFRK